ncbi:MAG: WG repeat-containing protein, partial [Spirochaetes bacterium]|nr:WG repeat-containing protein [Spirochaetota bacterium]
MINKTGKEIIPCKFDEIKYFMNHGTEEAESSEEYGASSYLMAHFGGWQNGNWGVIDYSGNWVVPP